MSARKKYQTSERYHVTFTQLDFEMTTPTIRRDDVNH